MQKITPNLWFDKNAEEAIDFYISVFKNVRVGTKTYYTEAGKEVHGMEAGTMMTADFEIEDYKFLALNGGPHFTFTPAISFMVNCEAEEEVKDIWDKLIVGGKALMPLDTYPFSRRYGWMQDRFGVSWQLITREKTYDQKIFPSLLFVGGVAGKAEAAINFYTSVFPNSQIGDIARYGAGQEPDSEGTVMYGEFRLDGQQFAAMDSAHKHDFSFNEAISLLITCADQAEIDYFWEKLLAVPAAEQCGWLKDQYGVSWQIVPSGMEKFLTNSDKDKADWAMNAMLQMKKIDIVKLEEAAR